MKHILIIAYYFPPDGGAGSQRPAKFCKYLPRYGWKPIVVTRLKNESRTFWDPLDSEMETEINENTTVLRVDFSELAQYGASKMINISEKTINTQSRLHRRIRSVVKEVKPDAALITMSPFNLSVIGNHIQNEYRIPVIYDLRDPWALDGVRAYNTKASWKNEYDRMRNILIKANGVIANTNESMKEILRHFPEIENDRIIVISNGFDADDFKKIDKKSIHEKNKNGLYFNIVHTGSFLTSEVNIYKGPIGLLRRLRHYRPEPIDASGRTPIHILRAIKYLRKKKCALGKKIKLHLVGQLDNDTVKCIRKSGVSDCVNKIGYVNHAESIKYLFFADGLFLHLHALPQGQRSLIVPGKTYEYIASGKPILGCLPAGDARDLVVRTGNSFCAKPNDAEDIAHAIEKMFEFSQFNASTPGYHNPRFKSYDRSELTKKLVRFINKLCN